MGSSGDRRAGQDADEPRSDRPAEGRSVSEAQAARVTSAAAALTTDTWALFTSGVVDVNEQGEEVVVSTYVWTVEELILTRHGTARTVLVRDTLRTVDVDVNAHRHTTGDPATDSRQ